MNIKNTILSFLLLGAFFTTKAQLMLNENFNYGSTADTLTNPAIGGATWKRHSGTGGPLQYLNTSLSYTGYASTGVGGSVSFAHAAGSREDVNGAFTNSVSSGAVYASFLVNVTNSGGTTGDYFFHLNDTNGNILPNNVFKGRVFLKDGLTGKFRLGLSKGGAAAAAVFSTTEFDLNQTYIVVVKYVFNTGSSSDDSVYATIISGTIPTSEPLFIVAASDITSSDLTKVKSVCFRQGTVGTGAGVVDGVRVATNWTDLIGTPSVVVTPPSPLTNLTVTGLTKNSAQVSYTKNVNYADSTMSVVVFAKKDTAVIAGTPTVSNAYYSASSDLMTPGTAYEHDANAFCVYKGDDASFTLSGMDAAQAYYLMAYVITDVDSLYSTQAVTQGSSSAKPAAVLSLSFTSGGQTSAKLKWTKPAAYINGTYTTIVFVKQDSGIIGLPTAPFAASYTASADFSTSSSVLETDTLATCVFNGDDDSVWVSGLTVGTTYYASVFVFREADSVYSAATTESVETDGLVPLPLPATNLVITQNGYSAMDLSWTKGLDYVDSSYTTLVFAKANTAVTAGANTTPVGDYIDSLNFGKGSLYQNDSMAFCIYKGDANSITTTGLMGLTQYHFSIYIVRESDTAYSNALIGNGTTLQGPPAPVSGLGAVALSQTSARLSWVKSPSYQNSGMTTFVFVKAGTINNGTVGRGLSGYFASTFFGNGTPFDADSLAYCVFKADTNFVTITGLQSQTNYEFEIFTMRDDDSTESIGVKASFATQGPPPVYTIGAINKVNLTTGVADSNGVRVTVRGVVYGGNQRVSGLQFVMRDETGGITAFITSKNFGYTVTEGDSLEVQGIVTTFRGLVEIGTLDTVVLLGTGKTLKAPTVVAKADESSENDLIRINNVKFITAPAGGVWPTASTNISVTNENGDTVVVRVLSTFAIAGKPLPSTPTFDIIGLGAQFSTSATAPYPFNGYQLFPRTQNDVIEIPFVPADSLSPFDLLTPSNNDTIEVTNANLGDSITISWSASLNSNGISSTDYTLYLDTVGGDFGSPIVEEQVGPLTAVKLTHEDILIGVLEPAGVEYGELFAAQWMVEASSDNLVRVSNQTLTVYLRNSIITGLAKVSKGIDFKLYPNPTTHHMIISGIAQNDVVTVTDITGKIIIEQTSSSSELTLSTADYRSGFYFVKVQSGDQVAIQKLLVN